MVAEKEKAVNEFMCFFSIKYHYSDIGLKNHFIYSGDKTFEVIRKMDFSMAGVTVSVIQ